MIEGLMLSNFQSHRDSTLEFVPGVNVIVGPSDAGKTALFRSMRWVAHNLPLGFSFCSHWAEETAVELTVDGHTVARVRSASVNTYEVDGAEEAAFGRDVPDSVAQLVRLGDINWGHQLSSPFLLSESPAEIARQLNNAADLQLIDQALTHTRKRAQTAARQLKDEETRLENQRDRLSTDFSQLDSLLDKQRQADEDMRRLSAICDDMGTLSRLLARHVSLRKSRKRLAPLCKHRTSMLRTLDEREVLLNDITALSELVQRATKHKKERRALAHKITKAEARFQRIMPDVCPLCGQDVSDEHKC